MKGKTGILKTWQVKAAWSGSQESCCGAKKKKRIASTEPPQIRGFSSFLTIASAQREIIIPCITLKRVNKL